MAGCLVILAATLVAYVPAMQGGWVWDDDFYVTENRALRDLDGLRRAWTDIRETPQYYPLTHTSFWVQAKTTGLDPFPFHLVNVLLHAASAIVLWRVLARLDVSGAWFAAALWALHPVQVESVAWVTERKNVLSGLFYLMAAWAYLKWALRREDEPERRGAAAVALPALAVLLFACALLSKTVTASLPVALAMVLLWRRRRLTRWDVVMLTPMLAAGAAMGRLTAFLEKHQVGASGPEWDFSLVDRMLIAGRAVWFYLGKLVWPFGLAFNYRRWEIDAGAAWQFLYPAAALALGAGLILLRRRIGWGPAVAYAYFVLTLSPALGFFDVFPMRYSFVADHFQYLASIGPLAVVAAVVWRYLPEIARRRAVPWDVATGRRVAVTAILVVLGLLTFRQGYAYADVETLWRHTVRRVPEAFMAHYNLAKLLKDRGEDDDAERHFLAAIAAKPDLVDAHVNLGNLRADQGRLEEAERHYRDAVAIDPDHALAHYNRALTLEQLGRPEEALRSYREAVRADPDLAAPHNNLAILLYHRGDLAAAQRELERFRALGGEPHPDFVRALREAQARSGPGRARPR